MFKSPIIFVTLCLFAMLILLKPVIASEIFSSEVYFPVSGNITWSIASAEHIDCNYDNTVKQLMETRKISGYAPIYEDNYSANGYYCTKIIKTTSCQVSFLGTEQVSYGVIYNYPSLVECQEAIHQFNLGFDFDFSPPDKTCSWMSTTLNQKSVIGIEVKQVSYDPFSDHFLSESFLNKHCEGVFCHTIHPNKIWIPMTAQLPDCIKKNLLEVVFYSNYDDPNNPTFWSPDFHIPANHTLCLKRFCGIQGIYFSKSAWIGIPNSAWDREDILISLSKNLLPCDQSSRLDVYYANFLERHHESDDVTRLVQEKCEELKVKMMTGMVVSRLDLQSLNPLVPGIHKVYILRGHVLYVGISYYRLVKIYKSTNSADEPIIIKDSAGSSIYWKEWNNNSRIGNVLDGPNGMFIYNGEFIYSFQNLADYSRIQKTMGDSVRVNSIRLDYLNPTFINHTQLHLYSNGNSSSISTLVLSSIKTEWNDFTSNISRLVHYLEASLAIGLSVIFLKKIIHYIKIHNKRSKIQNREEVPLSQVRFNK